MKKDLFLFLIFSSLSFTGFSQTATSVQNGDWMYPLTWSCTCVPLPGYSVTINHHVSLDTSFYVPSGGITINAGASLVGSNSMRDIWVNGGSLTNNGILDIRYLWTQTGTLANTGTITLQSFLNNVNFTNTGSFQNLDSMYTTGVVVNNGSFLSIDSITNGGTFTNNGMSVYNQFTNLTTYTNNNFLTFSDVTNLGTFTNADTVIASNSGWNAKNWNNLAGSFFLLNNGFLNAGDTALHNAVLLQNGRMMVAGSWYNADTVKGTSTGSIQVADSSVNWGWMKGTFDFCDLTPPAVAPYVDFNFGTISSGITWCQYNGVSELAGKEIRLFPNPASDKVYFEMENNPSYEVRIFNSSGALAAKYQDQNTIDVSALTEGLYFIQIVTERTTWTNKISIIK